MCWCRVCGWTASRSLHWLCNAEPRDGSMDDSVGAWVRAVGVYKGELFGGSRIETVGDVVCASGTLL